MNTDSWRILITDRRGRQLGGGVLVSHNIVLTCAHIFTNAGIHPPFSEAGVRAYFPFATSDEPFALEAMPDGWFPALRPDDGGDIAVLRLIGNLPDGVSPAPLSPAAGLHGETVTVFGAADDISGGAWVTRRLGRAAGPNAEWLQLDNPGTDVNLVAPGFSGGGMVHTGAGIDPEPVIGLMVAAGTGRPGQLSWMIPLDVVARYWRPLEGLLRGERRAGVRDEAVVRERLVYELSRLRSVSDRATLYRIVDLLPDVVRMDLAARTLGTPPLEDVVAACSRWSGGVRDLIHTVAYFERDLSDGRADLADNMIVEFGDDDLPQDRPPARYSGALQPAHRSRLVNALRRFERLRGAKARRLFLAMLADDVAQDGVRLDIPVTDDLVVDIHEVVNKCHGIPGAPQKVLIILQSLCDDEREALDNLAGQITAVYPEALLTDAERSALLGLLRNVPVTVLDRAYAQCLPSFALRRETPLADAGDYLRAVEGMTAPAGLPRIFHFVEHVAGRTDELREPLRVWSDRLAIRMRIIRDQVEDLRRGIIVGDEAVEPSFLVCRLMPDGVDPGQYVYSATIQVGSGAARQLASSDDPADLATTKAKIESTLKIVPRELNYNLDALTVELVLPRSLLTEPVDQWQFRDTQPYILGQRRRVVIRSYERLSSDHDHLWPQWFRKWRAVEAQSITGSHVMVFSGHAGAMAERDIRRLRSADVTLLALGSSPREQADLDSPDAITAALSEGVPFIIWCRDESLAEEFRGVLEGFLRQKPVRELPDQVYLWRSQPDDAGDGAGALSGALSLVACDAGRGPHSSSRYLNSPRREFP